MTVSARRRVLIYIASALAVSGVAVAAGLWSSGAGAWRPKSAGQAADYSGGGGAQLFGTPASSPGMHPASPSRTPSRTATPTATRSSVPTPTATVKPSPGAATGPTDGIRPSQPGEPSSSTTAPGPAPSSSLPGPVPQPTSPSSQPATLTFAPPNGWNANGSASPSGGAVQLTTTMMDQAGSALYATPVSTAGLTADFTVQMSGGTGGDGFTFALVDAAKGSASDVGLWGGGMGFSGLPGLAVVGAASWSSQLGYGNYMCIAQGPGDGGLDVDCLSAARLPASWGSGTHSVSVTVSGGVITVTLDGSQLLRYVPPASALPSSAYVGFTGSTGSATNNETVSGISVTATR